ncbi:MAG TPA: IMP cyclohydrolase [Candidatus Hydrogenedentes bacterium]|nr:IMP cyclohydrolase [Candidatus Hydrogenedentota bacterium]HOV72441.1 IMP cyclohydrolase [Candidatus Hydrogenedentota bacterium]HPC15395.1 IMP cyclohydrolase [Candidatus Hydrogenedentota bacterium]HRT20907.1 IMP cyclohydrolase [Candidatus Hydrogenedentota bacterium]HRT63430.1 IMP cyclohydrolase [Candidatus Hydrogenedentota bacterium]
MYIGRIVCVALTADGRLCASYRVSSRSFPNRTAAVKPDKVSIIPKPGFEADVQKNPYIAYNCARIVCGGKAAVVTNGSQTDAIAEKIAMGMPPRDALALSSLILDYEKDDFNTPRISAVADVRDGSGWLATVRHDALEVRRMPLSPGRFFYVATYEENAVSDQFGGDYDASDADSACDFILGKGVFAKREKPVTAVAAIVSGGGFELAAKDVSVS